MVNKQVSKFMQQNPSWWEADSSAASHNFRRTLRNPKDHFRFGPQGRAVFILYNRRRLHSARNAAKPSCGARLTSAVQT